MGEKRRQALHRKVILNHGDDIPIFSVTQSPSEPSL